MNFELSELRIKNNRLKRRMELKKHLILSLFGFVIAIGVSFLLFGLRIKAQGNEECVMYKYYKSIAIQEGDTLWGYAEEYGNRQYYSSNAAYIKEVMNINALSDDKIISGQYLILPYYSPEFLSDAVP